MADAAPPQFAFTKLVVADLEKSAAFYRQVFGVTDSARIESDIAGRAIEEIIFTPTAGGATFVLLHYLDIDTPSADELILGFVTPDIDALVQRAVAAGGTVVSAVQTRPELAVKVAFVADLEGHLVEVVQRMS